MTAFRRYVQHGFASQRQVRRCFSPQAMDRIEAAIGESERQHSGQLKFAVEAGLPWGELWRRTSPRTRALTVFSMLNIWDTEHNSGVLIYLLLADRKVEIIADRGINACVSPAVWQAICQTMQHDFRRGDFEAGVLAGIAAISALLQRHFPAGNTARHNEISDKPVIL